mgnify:CR=1 FL=1
MNRKLVVSILAILLVLTMVLSLVMSVIPTKARADGFSGEGSPCENAKAVVTSVCSE